MTSREEIERLLNQTGRTLKGLPEYYPAIDRIELLVGMGLGESCADRILHQSDVIELLIGALRDALEMLDKERTLVVCGNCKWYDSEFLVCSKCGVCVDRDFYCADGER